MKHFFQVSKQPALLFGRMQYRRPNTGMRVQPTKRALSCPVAAKFLINFCRSFTNGKHYPIVVRCEAKHRTDQTPSDFHPISHGMHASHGKINLAPKTSHVAHLPAYNFRSAPPYSIPEIPRSFLPHKPTNQSDTVGFSPPQIKLWRLIYSLCMGTGLISSMVRLTSDNIHKYWSYVSMHPPRQPVSMLSLRIVVVCFFRGVLHDFFWCGFFFYIEDQVDSINMIETTLCLQILAKSSMDSILMA
jgi:hypothetical protein